MWGLGSRRTLDLMTTPRPRAVLIGSLSLFAVLFVLLTIQLSTGSSSAGTQHRRAQPALVETQGEVQPEPEEAAPEYVEPEPEYEYVEPEVEEAPPVVTSSS